MARTHTTASADHLLGQPISEEKAAAQNAALDRVLEHLTAAGVHAELIKRLAVECAIKPDPSAATLWYPRGMDKEPRPDKIEVVSEDRPK
ncbi:hypothetical protein [Nonomuraea sp. B19D2]|uniref:hypothetical protein n=1 Tax=Nonomuraea sp. B19D2 TaxID=3159561 RepID=UPI0032D9DE46